MKESIRSIAVKERKIFLITIMCLLSAVIFYGYFFPSYRELKKAQKDIAALELNLLALSSMDLSHGMNIEESGGKTESGEEDFIRIEADVLFERLGKILKSDVLEKAAVHLTDIFLPWDLNYGWLVMTADFICGTESLHLYIGEIQGFCPCIKIESFQVQKKDHLYSGRIKVQAIFQLPVWEGCS